MKWSQPRRRAAMERSLKWTRQWERSSRNLRQPKRWTSILWTRIFRTREWRGWARTRPSRETSKRAIVRLRLQTSHSREWWWKATRNSSFHSSIKMKISKKKSSKSKTRSRKQLKPQQKIETFSEKWTHFWKTSRAGNWPDRGNKSRLRTLQPHHLPKKLKSRNRSLRICERLRENFSRKQASESSKYSNNYPIWESIQEAAKDSNQLSRNSSVSLYRHLWTFKLPRSHVWWPRSKVHFQKTPPTRRSWKKSKKRRSSLNRWRVSL